MIKTYSGRKLSRRPSARQVLLRALATSLIQHERITTTAAKAKELKVYTERLISHFKRIQNPVLKAREISRWLAPNGFGVEKKFLDVVLPRYSAKSGGYVRVVRLGWRASDGAPLGRIELIA